MRVEVARCAHAAPSPSANESYQMLVSLQNCPRATSRRSGAGHLHAVSIQPIPTRDPLNPRADLNRKTRSKKTKVHLRGLVLRWMMDDEVMMMVGGADDSNHRDILLGPLPCSAVLNQKRLCSSNFRDLPAAGSEVPASPPLS